MLLLYHEACDDDDDEDPDSVIRIINNYVDLGKHNHTQQIKLQLQHDEATEFSESIFSLADFEANMTWMYDFDATFVAAP